MIGGVSNVGIEVEDQDRAKQFWTEVMGFELVQDTPYKEGQRWLEVRTPDKAVVVGLGVRQGDRPSPSDEMLPTSNVWFYCDDLQQTHQDLAARGVEFPQPPVELFFGWWSIFTDPDGNRFALIPRRR
ncbi:MAG TPA: VOC family protein [Actinomycetes bacterium]|jgi:predicted enzyme related to lactoylglutathione lyase|nr:VOC family protein [Actinomycetes bacterium]